MKCFAKNNPQTATAICLVLLLITVTGLLLVQPQSVAGQTAAVCPETADAAVQDLLACLASGDKPAFSPDEQAFIDRIEQDYGYTIWQKVVPLPISGIAPYSEAVCVAVQSGQEISAQEYEQQLAAHVAAVCSDFALDPCLLSLKGPELLQLTPEETVKRQIVIQKITSSSPVRIETRAAVPYQYYQLHFSAADPAIDRSGRSVRVVFIQSGGIWVYDHIYEDAEEVFEDDV